MKILSLLLVFLIALSKAYSQDYDLIVKSSGDSIACHIVSITVTHIYFGLISNNCWIPIYIKKVNTAEIQHDVINTKQVVFKSGTSIIKEIREPKESRHVGMTRSRTTEREKLPLKLEDRSHTNSGVNAANIPRSRSRNSEARSPKFLIIRR